MNGDGHLDLVTHDIATGLTLYLGDGSGSTWVLDDTAGLPGATDALGRPMTDAYGIDIADLDGNGSLDIVRIASYDDEFTVEAWVR